MTDSSESGADYRLGYVDGAKTILKTIGDDLPEQQRRVPKPQYAQPKPRYQNL